MVWLALISVLNFGSSALLRESAHEKAGRSPSMLSRADVASSLALVVVATPDISNRIVTGALKEAAAIWSAAAVTLEWRVSTELSMTSESSTMQVILDEASGSVSDQDLPLGWISFSSSGVPERVVHLSHRNASQLVDRADAYRNRPTSYKELLMARALGRALAHELGHYLMASSNHAPSGLMKGRRLAEELFSPVRAGFQLNDDERRLAAHGLALTTANCKAGVKTPVENLLDPARQPVCCDIEFRREGA